MNTQNLSLKSIKILKEFKKFQVFLENNGLKTVQITLDPVDGRGEVILKEFKEFKVTNPIGSKDTLSKVG